MSEGDGMVTDGDREKAMQIMGAWDTAAGAGPEELRGLIAAALAEEREKARAPFLALADEAERRGRHEVAVMNAENDPLTAARYEGRAAAYTRAAFLIRHAAVESK